MNNNIKRLYDMRGKYPIDINEDIAYKVGKAYGSFLQINDYEKVCIGKDVRLSSDKLYEKVKQGLLDSGINVISLNKCTTPICAFSTIFFKCASLMVTASHNPKDENGFKFFLKNNYSLCGEKLKIFYEFLDNSVKHLSI